jgi:hypothetical protein
LSGPIAELVDVADIDVFINVSLEPLLISESDKLSLADPDELAVVDCDGEPEFDGADVVVVRCWDVSVDWNDDVVLDEPPVLEDDDGTVLKVLLALDPPLEEGLEIGLEPVEDCVPENDERLGDGVVALSLFEDAVELLEGEEVVVEAPMLLMEEVEAVFDTEDPVSVSDVPELEGDKVEEDSDCVDVVAGGEVDWLDGVAGFEVAEFGVDWGWDGVAGFEVGVATEVGVDGVAGFEVGVPTEVGVDGVAGFDVDRTGVVAGDDVGEDEVVLESVSVSEVEVVGEVGWDSDEDEDPGNVAEADVDVGVKDGIVRVGVLVSPVVVGDVNGEDAGGIMVVEEETTDNGSVGSKFETPSTSSTTIERTSATTVSTVSSTAPSPRREGE